jgi:hypothetical protein
VDIEELPVEVTGLVGGATLKVTGTGLAVKSTTLKVAGTGLVVKGASLGVLDIGLIDSAALVLVVSSLGLGGISILKIEKDLKL